MSRIYWHQPLVLGTSALRLRCNKCHTSFVPMIIINYYNYYIDYEWQSHHHNIQSGNKHSICCKSFSSCMIPLWSAWSEPRASRVWFTYLQPNIIQSIICEEKQWIVTCSLSCVMAVHYVHGTRHGGILQPLLTRTINGTVSHNTH